jgi:hypothetical protein
MKRCFVLFCFVLNVDKTTLRISGDMARMLSITQFKPDISVVFLVELGYTFILMIAV